MRNVPPNSLRLTALVAASMTAGYLWRAAFEAPRATPVPSAHAPLVLHFWDHEPGYPTQPPPSAAGKPRHEHARRARTSLATTQPHVRAKRRVLLPPPELASVTRPQAKPVGGSRRPRRQPPHKPAPKPQSPTPQQPKPQQPKPQQQPKPSPAASTPTPAPAAQTPAPATSTPTPAPAPSPAPQPSDSDTASSGAADTRPGWGKGDKNHVHTGPPGHSG